MPAMGNINGRRVSSAAVIGMLMNARADNLQHGPKSNDGGLEHYQKIEDLLEQVADLVQDIDMREELSQYEPANAAGNEPGMYCTGK